MAKQKFIGYKSYNFVDKDPIIDVLRTLIQISAAQRNVKFNRMLKIIEENSSVRVTTMHGWFSGDTISPRFCTAAAVARALGRIDLPLTLSSRSRLKIVKAA